MANLCDYVLWRGDLSFKNYSFNTVDALLLCQIAYLNLSDIVPEDFNIGISLRDAALQYTSDSTRGTSEEFGLFINPLCADLLKAAAQTERFSSILLKGFVNEVDRGADKQFAACTAILPTGEVCIIYRGTDDTIVGWKEDCLLCLPQPIPSHTAAQQYLAAAFEAMDIAIRDKSGDASPINCSSLRGKLYLAGHSKGGNLALYAAGAAVPTVQQQIERIFCFDSPGFSFDMMQNTGFHGIIPKISAFIPQSSVVGVLLSYFPQAAVIESSESNTLWQHDAFSWQINRDTFVPYKAGRTQDSFFAEHTVQTWLSHLDEQKRRSFIETFFGILFSTGAETLTALTAHGVTHSLNILKELRNIDSQQRKEMFNVLKYFFEAAYAHFPLRINQKQGCAEQNSQTMQQFLADFQNRYISY